MRRGSVGERGNTSSPAACFIDDSLESLLKVAGGQRQQQRHVQRARLVLAVLDSGGIREIACDQSCSPPTVRTWCRRRLGDGRAGLVGACVHGRPCTTMRPAATCSLWLPPRCLRRSPAGVSRNRQGRRRREFEYVRHGTISWCGVQVAATGVVEMIRARTRMDSTAFMTDGSAATPHTLIMRSSAV